MAWTLAISGGVSLLAAIVFAYVGRRFSSRPREAEDRLAARAFGTWWFGIAAYTAMAAALDLLAAAGSASFPVHVAWRYLSIPVLCVALWGLMGYLAYLFTGRAWTITATGGLYALLALAATAHVALSRPVGVVVMGWRTDLAYATAFEGGPFVLLLALLVLPQIVGAAAYLALAPRAPDRASRLRILLVGAGILVWLSSALVARMSDDDAWQFFSRPVLGLAVAGAILYAYHAPLPPSEERARREGLRRRIADLV